MHKKKAGKLQTGSTIPKQYWLAVNGKPKRLGSKLGLEACPWLNDRRTDRGRTDRVNLYSPTVRILTGRGLRYNCKSKHRYTKSVLIFRKCFTEALLGSRPVLVEKRNSFGVSIVFDITHMAPSSQCAQFMFIFKSSFSLSFLSTLFYLSTQHISEQPKTIWASTTHICLSHSEVV